MTNMVNEENVCISISTEQIKETLDLHLSCFFSVTRFFHFSLAPYLLSFRELSIFFKKKE